MQSFWQNPPCTDTIIQSGIKKVVIGALDPNQKLLVRASKTYRCKYRCCARRFGKRSCDANKFFFFRHINKRPFVTIKIASSSDGMSHAKDGSIKWITSLQLEKMFRICVLSTMPLSQGQYC